MRSRTPRPASRRHRPAELRASRRLDHRSVVMTELGGLIAGAAPLLASHLALVLVALAVAVAIGLPLAVVLVRRPRAAGSVMTVAGAIQTIPSLALLALMVPVLAASHGLGVGISSAA